MYVPSIANFGKYTSVSYAGMVDTFRDIFFLLAALLFEYVKVIITTAEVKSF